jgi:cobalt-zinc-cadmium efflux system membrane fusion protein
MKTFVIFLATLLIAGLRLGAAEDEHAGHDHAGHDHAEHEPHVEEQAVTLTPETVAQHGIAVAPAAESTALTQPVIAPAWVAYDPDRMAYVGSVVHGRVAKLHVAQGAPVKAGDALIDIDSTELGRAQNEFLQKRAARAVAEAGVGIAEQSFQRAEILVKQSAMPAAEGQRREADLARARTELMAAEADLSGAGNALVLLGLDQAARDELSRTGGVSPRLTLRAPIDGIVIARPAIVGQAVGPETEALLTIADPNALWVMANVPEHQAAAIAVGAKATITGPLLKDGALETTVQFVSPSVDAATRSVQMRMTVDGASGLRPGAFVQVELQPQDSHSSVVVPRDAVFTFNGATTVFIQIAGANRYVAREVEASDPVGEVVPIIAGLNVGDNVVVKGGFLIKADLGKAGAKGCCDTH